MRSLHLLRWTVLLGLGAAALPAAANDSTAELSVGGLVFTRSVDISVESEDLTISPEAVSVRYVFVNRSRTPVTATVAFPLPDIDLSEADNYALPVDDPVNFLAFETKVDGKPISFRIHQRALLGDKDISAVIKEAGVPVLPLGAQRNRIAELPKAAKDRLIEDGLLVPAGSDPDGEQLYSGSWTVRTAVIREQTFPPGKPVVVEHRYRTSMGMSFDTVLRKGLRDNKALEAEVKRYRATYCVRDDLLRGIDRIAGSAEANTRRLHERRISYVLKTAANWAGPIKDFRLVVDKGRADRLVSFCLDNVRKISPIAVEIRIKDFVPTRDLDILLIGKGE